MCRSNRQRALLLSHITSTGNEVCREIGCQYSQFENASNARGLRHIDCTCHAEPLKQVFDTATCHIELAACHKAGHGDQVDISVTRLSVKYVILTWQWYPPVMMHFSSTYVDVPNDCALHTSSIDGQAVDDPSEERQWHDQTSSCLLHSHD